MRNRNLLYLVEGDDEKKLVNTLKNSMGLIHPGKVQKLNVIECNITDLHLRTLAKGTIVVLIFDTDTDNVARLDKTLKSSSHVLLFPRWLLFHKSLISRENWCVAVI